MWWQRGSSSEIWHTCAWRDVQIPSAELNRASSTRKQWCNRTDPGIREPPPPSPLPLPFHHHDHLGAIYQKASKTVECTASCPRFLGNACGMLRPHRGSTFIVVGTGLANTSTELKRYGVAVEVWTEFCKETRSVFEPRHHQQPLRCIEKKNR